MDHSFRKYLLDRNHAGIRFAVVLALILGMLLGLLVLMPAALGLLRMTGLPELCVSVVGVLAFGLVVSWGVEKYLPNLWPSGNRLEVSDEYLILRQGVRESITLKWRDRINVLSWHFVIRRGRTWVPRGWYCAACRLTQDENVISVYSFMKPEQAEQMPQWRGFELLVSAKQAPRRGEEYLLARVAEQGQLRSAEKDRWDSGVEMQPGDFAEFVGLLAARVPDWPQGPR